MSEVHPQARTTPHTRAEIHSSKASLADIAEAYNISEATARKWKRREDMQDRSHQPHTLSTTLTPTQELLVVELRRMLMPLEDLLVMTREFINVDKSRSGLDRRLRRSGVNVRASRVPVVEGALPAKKKAFKDHALGSVHVDIKHLPQIPADQWHVRALQRANQRDRLSNQVLQRRSA